MSGRRSATATQRRRKARRTQRQRTQEHSVQVASHGETTNEATFDKPTSRPCPDCNLENRLRSTDLRPSPIGAIPLAPSRLSKWRPTASIGCETCDGTGAVPLDPFDQVDPYDVVARQESRQALELLELWRQRTSPSLVVSVERAWQ